MIKLVLIDNEVENGICSQTEHTSIKEYYTLGCTLKGQLVIVCMGITSNTGKDFVSSYCQDIPEIKAEYQEYVEWVDMGGLDATPEGEGGAHP